MTSRQRVITFGVVALLALFAQEAEARCVCECVNGEMRPLCENITDMAPVCPQRPCPMVPPSLGPTPAPAERLPLGASECQDVQVLNPSTGRYEWKRVCR